MTINKATRDEIEKTLRRVERQGSVANIISEEPGVFLHRLYVVWHNSGGYYGGKYYRNSIRRMRDLWLTEEKSVKSLHPKLAGRVGLTKKDLANLIDLVFYRWRFAEDGESPDTEDGYISFPSEEITKIKTALLDWSFLGVNNTELKVVILKPDGEPDIDLTDISRAVEIFVDRQYRGRRAIITLSRHKTVIGPSPADTMNTFWHLMSLYNNIDTSEEGSNSLLIWVLDMGSRLVEESDSFNCFYNVISVVSQFLGLAHFDSSDDAQASRGLNLQALRVVSSEERRKRWDWLLTKTVFVLQNLRKGEFSDQNDEELRSIELSRGDVTAEHVFPRSVPAGWSGKLRDLYGRTMKTLEDATFSVTVKSGNAGALAETENLAYFAHARLVSGATDDFETATVRSVELNSPGSTYDKAMTYVYLAAKYRADETVRNGATDEAIAAAYLKEIGFETISLKDLIQLVCLPNL